MPNANSPVAAPRDDEAIRRVDTLDGAGMAAQRLYVARVGPPNVDLALTVAEGDRARRHVRELHGCLVALLQDAVRARLQHPFVHRVLVDCGDGSSIGRPGNRQEAAWTVEGANL